MAIPQIRVTNSLTGKKEILETRVPGKLTMYSCGPTVYNFIHIGNLRAAVTADLFARSFRKLGYEVTFVRNYTDVDDRIIEQSIKEGITAEAVSQKYIREVEKDYAAALMIEPDHKTIIVEHIPEIIEMISKIISNGKAYVAEDGEVLFEVSKFPEYTKLSKKNLEDLIAGARVDVDAKKRNPADFALWKPAKPGEPFWKSPWCNGRPGWHIECSAMASKWLGEQIDVHHGGSDLIFPHHENEIAQSEAASGKAPYVKYWLHSAMLNINAEKMSKSLGNVVLARDFLTAYGGEVARMMLLTPHYRSLSDFGEETLETALSSLQRLYEAKLKALELKNLKVTHPDLRAEALWGGFVQECENTSQEITDHMANDFNTPGVVASLFNLIRSYNKCLGEVRAAQTPAAILASTEFIRVIEEEFGSFMGLGRQSPYTMLEKLNSIRATLNERKSGSAKLSVEQIEALIAQRVEAKKAKNFSESDRIRDELKAKGVQIKDSPQGTTWSYV